MGDSLRIDVAPIAHPTYEQQLAKRQLLQVACITQVY